MSAASKAAVAACGLVGIALVAAMPAASAADGKAAKPAEFGKTKIGFSKLVVRLDGSDSIGMAGADFHVRILERMRAKGFAAVGAEDLVFDKDHSAKAEVVLGGTVRELVCEERSSHLRCRIGVEWQLLDLARDGVVYSVLSRAAVFGVPSSDKDKMTTQLVLAAVDDLLAREKFRAALVAAETANTKTDPTFEAATYTKCAPGRKMSESSEDLLRATVVVKTRTGFGSGFFITSDGLVMTAAHVVDGDKLTVRMRDGREVDAVAVRVARAADVALLRVDEKTKPPRCAALKLDLPEAGAEVYAAGAPTSLDLAFSLSRGIVSGTPTLEGRRRLQTDASLNGGNSGGPVVDSSGMVLGVVSFKIVGGKVEGLGFAVPSREALAALALTPGDSTSISLRTETAKPEAHADVEKLVDSPTDVPSLEPEREAARVRARAWEATHAREEADRQADRDDIERRTPGWLPWMRWGGLGLAVAGSAAGAFTYMQYQGNVATTKQPNFETLKVSNAIAWSVAIVGAGAFGVSFLLTPKSTHTASAPLPTVHVGFGGVSLEGRF